MVSTELSKRGFRINHSKIKFLFENKCQEVLGIKVNDKLSIDRNIRHKLRAKIHQNNLNSSDYGMLAFIKSVNLEQYEKLTVDGAKALRFS